MAMCGHASKRPLPPAAHAGEGIVCVWGAIVGLGNLRGSAVQWHLSAGLQSRASPDTPGIRASVHSLRVIRPA